MSPLDAGSAAHLVGYLVAITIYAMLFAMVWPTRRESPLSLATAVMGCVWNLGSLWRYAASELALVPVSISVGVATFAAIDLLPAVVVHSVLRNQLRGPRAHRIKLLTAAAYTLSASAAVSHVYAATTLGVPLFSEMHHLIGPGFGILLSRGTLANLDLFKSVSLLPGGTQTVTLTNGQELKVSRTQARVLRDQLLRL
ncbi:MAG: hypothetical protein QGG24_01375 [Vicinamibacterales bacterium]|jgi:hypothetical protein|nr:hypothetical protein [Vicinamibacterales bacterium]MDP7470766.1 hypothetical protein [Vicinamibacterales bacterium]MDP7671795.1 hypothetical protein [Vicinamibacterales bacterium]HJO38350.1 hypothetical protein [Vicinamibacterales bacterium]|tara:strand:+ start:436 stop:1029 length:594 start_codon:yes stop_codon:yes gene_type:complete